MREKLSINDTGALEEMTLMSNKPDNWSISDQETIH